MINVIRFKILVQQMHSFISVLDYAVLRCRVIVVYEHSCYL